MVGMFQEIYSELGLSGPLVSAATENEHPVLGKWVLLLCAHTQAFCYKLQKICTNETLGGWVLYLLKCAGHLS